MTETTTAESTEVELLPPTPAPVYASGTPQALGTLLAHVDAMNAAMQLAKGLAASELVPALYRGNEGNTAVAILYGAELGLNPIQSVQQIFVVHGTPSIYARTAVALVKRATGIPVQTVESTDERVTVTATDPKTGQTETSTWDIARAEKAKYTGNQKYTTDPQAMLYAKAAMEVCRKIAPDVLLGIPYSREELELEPQPIKVQSERLPQRAKGTSALRERAAAASGPQSAQAAETAGELSPDAREKWLKAMFAALNKAECTDRDEQLIVIAGILGRTELFEHRADMTDQELRTIVNALNGFKEAGRLEQQINEYVNAWSLREADELDAVANTDTDGGEQGELGLESDQN